MQEARKSLIRIEKTTLFLMVGCFLFCALCGWHFFSYGLVVGAILGIINFRLLTKSTILFTSREKINVYGYFFFIYLSRFLLMGIVFSICLIKELRLFLGAATGFLFVQVSIFLNNFWLYRE